MSVSPDYLVDGNYSLASPVGPPRLSYPFIGNKDRVSAVFEQEFWQTVETFAPGYLSVRHSDALADFYMVDEGEPERFAANIYRFMRKFARVPVPQVTFSSLPINKPSAAQLGGVVAPTEFVLNSAGTIIGVTTTYLGVKFLPDNTIYGAPIASTSVDSGADTRVTSVLHGLTGTETIIARMFSPTRYKIFTPSQYSVIDANNFDLLGINYGALVLLWSEYIRNYSPGVDRVKTRNTTTFYLPGVTPGITTAEDIPIPAVAINDVDFMALVIAVAGGFQTYDADPLALWMGQIYQQRVIEIDLDDV